MSPSFESLREQLLHAGIPPRRVHRYVDELREHLADLTARERATGLDATAASERAATLLGSQAELARAMIAKAPRRALAVRAPWTVFLMSPVVLLLAAIAGIDLLMMNLLSPVQPLSLTAMPPSYRNLVELASLLANYLVVALLAAGCITVAVRQRMASGWVWSGLGLICVLSGLVGFHFHEFAPLGSFKGGMVFSAVDHVYRSGRPDPAATLALAALRAAILFAVAAGVNWVVRLRVMATPNPSG